MYRMRKLLIPPARNSASSRLAVGLAAALAASAYVVVQSAAPTAAVQPAGSVIELQVTGQAGVPADAAAVVLNIAAVAPTAPGFVTAYPCGEDRPTASTLNYQAGVTIANNATVAVGDGGKVCLYTLAGADLIADVSGWYQDAPGFEAVAPQRLFDSRLQTRLQAGSTYELQVIGRAGVPANATGAILNIAAVDPRSAGFVTAYPCGTSRPTASNINHQAAVTLANNVNVAIGSTGKVCLYTLSETDLVVDLAGWYASTSGMQSGSPVRLVDTRSGGPRPAGSTYEFQVTGHAGVEADAEAAVLNIAAVDPAADGFFTVYPCGEPQPLASTVNYRAGVTIANNSTVPIGVDGKVCVYTLAQAHIVADLNGWHADDGSFVPHIPERLLDTRTSSEPTTAPPAPAGVGDFVESFDGNSGRNRFATGVFHRDETLVATTQWPGDHDMACNGPDTERTIHRDNHTEYFYVCKDHWMTSLGDTSGYSIAWFSPDANTDHTPDLYSRADTRTISWDVNITDLGARLWWEVVLVSPDTPFLTTIKFVADTAEIEPYHPETIAVGTGPYGRDGNIYSDGTEQDPLGWGHVCDIDPEGCDSKAIRRPFSMTDNGNGTITFHYLGQTYTYDGQFPDTFNVYFKEHAYTPNKDGAPVGYTTHWDNIAIR